MIKYFFELLRVAIGTQKCLSRPLCREEWEDIYDIATKQTLIGICMGGIIRMNESGFDCGIPDDLYWEWYGVAAGIQQDNDDANKRSAKVHRIFRSAGFETCILKGQGICKYYLDDETVQLSSLRQTGDVDVWMWPKGDWTLGHDARMKCVVDYIRKLGSKSKPTYHNIAFNPTANFFIEAHYTPSWSFSPFRNKRMQRWFEELAPEEMQYDFSTLRFNSVFIMLHIYRHLFGEGIGLRQVLDYFFVLQKRNKESVDNDLTFKTLKSFGLSRFSGALMWIMQSQFGLKEECLICKSDKAEGEFLLSEILQAGNFGKYDERIVYKKRTGIFNRFCLHVVRNLHFLSHYPTEVLWCPFWKVWHQLWLRKYMK